jgi:hypothetical protein
MSEETLLEGQNPAEGQTRMPLDRTSPDEEMPLEQLELSTRVLNVLKDAGLETVQDLLKTLAQGEDEFLAIDQIGQKSLDEVRDRLAKVGFLGGTTSGRDGEETDEKGAEPGELPGTRSKRREASGEEAGAAVAGEDGTDVGAQAADALADVPSTGKEEEMAEERISFVVRLTVDEMGRPRRTAIEHAESRKKDTSPGLDLERLGSFMKNFIKTTSEKGLRESAKAHPEGPEPKGPEKKIGRALWISISEVQAYPLGAQDFVPLAFDPEQELVVEACFELKGQEATALTAKEPPYEMTVYVQDVSRGSTSAVTSSRDNLVQGELAYTPQIEVSDLMPGLYRLMTFISVLSPEPMRAHYEGPVIQVGELQPVGPSSIGAGVHDLP